MGLTKVSVAQQPEHSMLTYPPPTSSNPPSTSTFTDQLLLAYGPLLYRKDLVKAKIVGRTRSYDIANPLSPAFDPAFPQGFKIGNFAASPTLWWTTEIGAWLEAKSHQKPSPPRSQWVKQ